MLSDFPVKNKSTTVFRVVVCLNRLCGVTLPLET